MDFALHADYRTLAGLASEWDALLAEGITHVPFLRYRYLEGWWATRGGGEWPQAELAVVTASQAGRLRGVAPLFRARNPDGREALFLLGSIEISDYLDLIVRPADHADFLTGTLDFLSSSGPNGWELLDWHNLPEGSPTLARLAAEGERRGWSFQAETTYHAPSIPLPGDFQTYLAGIDKKQRHEIRRKVRRAEESGSALRWYIVEDGASLEAEVEAFLGLMGQDPNKAAFLSPAMRRAMHLTCQAAFQEGWLQLAFLEVDGSKAAGYLNFDYLGRIWVYNSGLDRRFQDLSAGWVLLAYLLEWANDHQRTEFDFLRGHEDYKYRFGAVDRLVLRACLRR